jgi:CelD/BcsL family acetyltransferase involved in cellulose biosynthesis
LPEVPCGAFHRIELRQLPAGSALLRAAAPPGWSDEPGGGEGISDEPCLVAPLMGDDGVGAATKKCCWNWRYAMRRIGREGGAVERVPTPEIAQGMAELSRLHSLRWRARGEAGVLSDGLLDTFLREAASELGPAGLLRLYRVRFGAETVAVLLVLAGHAAHHYFLGGLIRAWPP